jgi:phenylalanyl-tRNA synthetase alpha subunit
MKLLLKQPFSLEIPHENGEDEILTGTLAPLNKKQLKEFKTHFKKDQDLSNKLSDLSRELSRLEDKARHDGKVDLDKKYKLEDKIRVLSKELKDLNTEETTAKKRFDLSVESEYLDRIKEIAEFLSYREVLDVIINDIEDRKGNDIPA